MRGTIQTDDNGVKRCLAKKMSVIGSEKPSIFPHPDRDK